MLSQSKIVAVNSVKCCASPNTFRVDKAELYDPCCLSVCLFVCHTVSRITYERVNGCRLHMVGKGKD